MIWAYVDWAGLGAMVQVEGRMDAKHYVNMLD